jgi:ribosomal protein S18 acetylase RimI-like enzyme
VDVGARKTASDTENFSYRNVHLALFEHDIAGMLLAYRLPDAGDTEEPEDFPEFIRPLIELEQCVAGNFCINMLATCPEYRNQAAGAILRTVTDKLAAEAGCSLIRVEVFAQNEAALGLCRRLGYFTVEKRPVIPHPCHPCGGEIVLLTKKVPEG